MFINLMYDNLRVTHILVYLVYFMDYFTVEVLVLFFPAMLATVIPKYNVYTFEKVLNVRYEC